jgi:hypothetical protein
MQFRKLIRKALKGGFKQAGDLKVKAELYIVLSKDYDFNSKQATVSNSDFIEAYCFKSEVKTGGRDTSSERTSLLFLKEDLGEVRAFSEIVVDSVKYTVSPEDILDNGYTIRVFVDGGV